MTQDELKKAVARAAVDYITPKLFNDSIIGVGTGSTANFLSITWLISKPVLPER